MHINEYGQVSRTDKEVIELLYQNPDIDLSKLNFIDPHNIEKFNQAAKLCGINLNIHANEEILIPLEEFDNTNQKNWFIPEDKIHHNLFEMLYGMCDTEEKQTRVSVELELFIKHDMIELLHYLKYLVDLMREQKIIWGVGRGSSVASYVLYLIGVHKIDSIKYNLDITEFLK